MDELISDFAADTRDGYDQVRRYLDGLDASSMDRATLDAVFRFVHTVRGNASFLNIERIERLCAPTEYILSKVREDAGTPPPTLVAAVIAIVDRLGAIAEAMEEGVNLPAGDEMALISALGPAGDGSAPPVALRRSLRAPTIRLSVEKFDTLITTIELLEVAQRALLDQVARQALPVDLDSVLAQVTSAIAAAMAAVADSRTQSFGDLFIGLDRFAAQTALVLGKRVRVETAGADVSIKREQMNILRDCFVHIVRNAIDHGIETPAERDRLGKPSIGVLTIRAERNHNGLEITVSDDGRGVDATAVRQMAQNFTMPPPTQTRSDNLFSFLALPGFSMALDGSFSGHGVGLDVVNERIHALGGTVCLTSHPGQGMTLTIFVPDILELSRVA